MTTLEATVSTLEFLPEAQLLRVKKYAEKLADKQSPYAPVSRRQVIKTLKKAQKGKYVDAAGALEKMGHTYSAA